MALGSTVYPQMIGLASTFEPELAKKMTEQIRKQMLAIGARQGLAPVLDVVATRVGGGLRRLLVKTPCL